MLAQNKKSVKGKIPPFGLFEANIEIYGACLSQK
jgi:hypothetical protein